MLTFIKPIVNLPQVVENLTKTNYISIQINRK